MIGCNTQAADGFTQKLKIRSFAALPRGEQGEIAPVIYLGQPLFHQHFSGDEIIAFRFYVAFGAECFHAGIVSSFLNRIIRLMCRKDEISNTYIIGCFKPYDVFQIIFDGGFQRCPIIFWNPVRHPGYGRYEHAACALVQAFLGAVRHDDAGICRIYGKDR